MEGKVENSQNCGNQTMHFYFLLIYIFNFNTNSDFRSCTKKAKNTSHIHVALIFNLCFYCTDLECSHLLRRTKHDHHHLSSLLGACDFFHVLSSQKSTVLSLEAVLLLTGVSRIKGMLIKEFFCLYFQYSFYV